MLSSTLRLLLLAALSTSLFGCAAVAPWERAYLAKKKMQMDPDAEAVAFEQHVFEYREGASGGYGSVGGGCGCN
jgi:Domain of unknown function (DUF4266)